MLKICSICNEKPVLTKGLCNKCNLRQWLQERSDNSPKIECECGCGELIPSINKRGKKARFKTHHNITSGSKALHWKGGIIKNGQGYTFKYAPTHPFKNSQNYVRLHRYNKEIYLSVLNGYPTYIHPSLDCHHDDENKDNNHWSNIRILSHSEHLKCHINNPLGKNKKRF